MATRLFSIQVRSGKVPTSHWLLVARASAALETYPDPELAVPVSEQVDLFALPTGNDGVEPAERLEEARRVLDYWPPALLREAASLEVPWHLLYEPTRWADVAQTDVWNWILAQRNLNAAWPNIGLLRVQFGRTHNHPVRVAPGQSEIVF